MRKTAAFIMIVCLFMLGPLSGCTSESHRVIITVKNNRDTTQEIQLHIDGSMKFSARLDPAEGVEREYELEIGDHTFELYHEVSGSYELYKTETIYMESDSSVFFELE